MRATHPTQKRRSLSRSWEQDAQGEMSSSSMSLGTRVGLPTHHKGQHRAPSGEPHWGLRRQESLQWLPPRVRVDMEPPECSSGGQERGCLSSYCYNGRGGRFGWESEAEKTSRQCRTILAIIRGIAQKKKGRKLLRAMCSQMDKCGFGRMLTFYQAGALSDMVPMGELWDHKYQRRGRPAGWHGSLAPSGVL